jgi:hypothetical protein
MLDSTRSIISFKSAKGDRQTAVLKGVMLRAAELSKEKGFDGFIIVSDQGNESTAGFTTAGTAITTQIGNQSFTNTVGAVPMIIEIKSHSITIRFVNKGEGINNGYYNADEVINLNRPFFN